MEYQNGGEMRDVTNKKGLKESSQMPERTRARVS